MAVKTGATTYEANRLVAAKSKWATRMFKISRTINYKNQPPPQRLRCQQTFRTRIAFVGHLPILCIAHAAPHPPVSEIASAPSITISTITSTTTITTSTTLTTSRTTIIGGQTFDIPSHAVTSPATKTTILTAPENLPDASPTTTT
nr:unnamed protein product [Spirometra erinaceieuropaei]